MNSIINNCLSAGDKFMAEMHLRQPQFVYSACGPFTRHKERIKEFKRTGDTPYVYRNELDKACFQHDLVYKFFDKKSTGSGIASSSALADELHKPVIKKFNKRKV